MKNLFDLKIDEKGFVLIEFVIALPLIIFLLYGFTQTLLKGVEMSKFHAADYELEVEAQEVLTRIVEEVRTASQVKRQDRFGNMEIDTLSIQYHVLQYDAKRIIDVIDRRVYVSNDSYKLNAKRQLDGTYLNPITGGSSFGDTVIKRLRYSRPADKVLHITLEMESLTTHKRIKLSTAVYMPACERMDGF